MKQVTTPEWKSIINISSIEGIIGEPQLAAYNASKGGVRLLSKSTALYGVRYQIRCTSIHPGYIETPMVMRPAEHRGSDGEAWLDDVKSRHPMGRLGKPREIADAVVFLASEESSFVGALL